MARSDTPRPDDLTPLREAAALVDRSLSTVRGWARSGALTTWRGPGPPSNAPVLVSRAELLALVVSTGKAADPPRPPTAPPAPAAPLEVPAELRAEISTLRADLAELRGRLAVAEAERAGAVALVEAERRTVAAVEARVRDLAVALEAERARAVGAEAERDALRAAERLPWWRRLLGVAPGLAVDAGDEH